MLTLRILFTASFLLAAAFFAAVAPGAHLPALSTPAYADDEEPDSFDLLGEFPTSESSKRIRPFQVRWSLIYGQLTFGSSRAATTSSLSINGVQAGSRLELEHWFHVGAQNRRSLGFMADIQFLYVGRFKLVPGDPISYLSASTMLAWRAFGYGHTVPWSPELTLFAGPALEVFPAMDLLSDYFGNYSYTLNNPEVLGAKVGTRLRFPLFSKYTAVEATGFYIYPLETVGGASGGQLSLSDTQSLGATALLDLQVAHNMIAGAGFYWGWFKLNFVPAGAASAEETIFYTRSFLVSARFNF